jgi:diguanylate cyclase (GGDEF)-like protein/PAS domain S-box-containing protein
VIDAPPPMPGDDWFHSLALATAAAVLLTDGERVLFANPAAERLTGLPVERLLGVAPLDLVHPDDREAAGARLAARLAGETVAPATVRVRRPDGEVRWAELSASRVALDDGRPGVLYSADDVTGRREVEDELARLRARHTQALETLARERDRAHVTLAAIGDGVVRTDADGRIETMNPVAERLLGRPVEEAAGLPFDEVASRLDEATARPLEGPLALCLAQRRRVDSPPRSLLVPRDGEEVVVQESAAPVLDRDGALAGAVLVLRDVTRLSGMEREISYFATHDPLTGLVHRRELERRLARHLESGTGRGGALIHLDVDEFRVVNDLCGHSAGDELLREVAERLYELVGEAGVVARMGADEFGVLLPRAGADEGRRRAEELRAAIAEHRFRWRDHDFDVRASVGVVPLDAAGSDMAQVVIAAEAACLAAKERGRDRVHEYRADDRELVARHGEMQWIHRIHRAFEEERFCLHRQPIRALREDGEQGLCEVLIRMRDEDGRLVAPGAFIPAAERYHLIPAIDRWVVRTALAGLPNGDGGGCVAVNVSGLSLSDEGFLDDVVAALDASGADPRRLCFEITETAAVAHLARAHRFMAVLRAQGCRFVLDDFGSGMSSFAYLKNLPVDFLKISSQFVRGLEDSELQRALVRSIHQIGDLMRMGTIAEGVETAAALAALEEVGVHYAQGFWIGRPEPL